MKRRLKERVNELLDISVPGDTWGRVVDIFLIALITTNVLAIVIETVPELGARYRRFFDLFEFVSVLVFTVEYILRVWSCTVDRAHRYDRPFLGRLKFMISPMAIVDLLSFLPSYFGTFFGVDLRILRLMRMVRLLKLSRYSPALFVIAAVIRNQARALLAALFVMMTALVFSSSIIYVVEHAAQPDKFGSIPQSMWWAMSTLSTVGYGDVTPVTPLGRLFGGITMIIGIGMFALPTGVVAIGFAQEIRKHDFIVTWRLVAKVPLFVGLDAAQIADIVGLLKPIMVPPRHAVVRLGEAADSMFFIVSGELEVEVPPTPARLTPGEFFGEMGLITRSVRSADVVSLTECQLLQLAADDFWKLVEIHPDLGDKIREVMDERLARRSAPRSTDPV